jgi:thiosulfate oxidation carrier complex protein SoxZ
MSNARMQLPTRIAHGDVVKARLLIQHPMDSGYLQDLRGLLIPRNVIVWLTCDYAGQQVFKVEPSSGVAGNPLFEFFFRAVESGELLVRWVDDLGVAGELRQTVKLLPPASRPLGQAPQVQPARRAS